MARKINLRGLHDNGDLTVTKFNITEDATSDGISALFDGDSSVLKFQANQHSNSAFREQLKLNFSQAIKGNKFRIRVTTKTTADYNIHLNGDTNNLQSVSGLAASVYFTSQNFNFSISSLNEIRISLGSSFSNGDHQVYEIELFITEEADPYEFNDSVLTTHAWNSSRYDGRQLSGSKLNKFTSGDSTYGLTPVISNLTRTFYISSDITSLSNDGTDGEGRTVDNIEDPTLQFIPGFSYVLINKAVTINDDNSIKVTDLSTFNTSPGGVDRKKGFDREFQTNIPNGSFIGIKNLDADIKDRTNNNYKVYFNAGRLQPMVRVQPTDEGAGNMHVANSTTPTTFIYSGRVGNSPAQDETIGTVRNAKRLRQYYTGSFRGLNQTNIRNLFSSLEAKRKSASPDRFFISLLNTSGALAFDIDPLAVDVPVIITTSDDEVSGSGVTHPTQNLAELSTAEFTELQGEKLLTASLSSTFSFNQKYEIHSSYFHNISYSGAPFVYSGSYDISFLNENKPSLLIEMEKKNEFPDGIGRTPLVVIPETLHPYIKDNIPQFMARAGFDIGDITQVNTLDETNRTLS